MEGQHRQVLYQVQEASSRMQLEQADMGSSQTNQDVLLSHISEEEDGIPASPTQESVVDTIISADVHL